MKRFRLIEERSTFPGLSPEQAEADRVDYIACIYQVVRQPLPQMPWLEDAEKSGRIDRALAGKEIGDILELEDADWQHLCEKVRNARWSVVDMRLLRFSHTILNATDNVLDDAAPTPTPAGSTAESEAAHTNGVSSGSAYGATPLPTSPVPLAPGLGSRPGPLRSRRKPGPA